MKDGKVFVECQKHAEETFQRLSQLWFSVKGKRVQCCCLLICSSPFRKSLHVQMRLHSEEEKNRTGPKNVQSIWSVSGQSLCFTRWCDKLEGMIVLHSYLFSQSWQQTAAGRGRRRRRSWSRLKRLHSESVEPRLQLRRC